MGLFLSMSGVIGCDQEAVAESLRRYAATNNGVMVDDSLKPHEDDCLVISEGVGGVTVLYRGNFFAWDDASEFLSRDLDKPVFSLHIHDGDLWMYVLFDKGELVDQFNPIPDYWEEISEEERNSWRGIAREVAKRVPGLAPQQIANYLTIWGDDVFEATETKKAYPTDKFHFGDDWQLLDFMDKIGLDYPIDDHGEAHGDTFCFSCPPSEVS